MKIKIITTEKEQWMVLSPENQFEKKALDMFDGQPNMFRAEFAESQGGYLRMYTDYSGHTNDLIIKFPRGEKEKKPTPPQT